MKDKTVMVWRKIATREYFWWIILLVFSLTGVLLMRYMTPNGMGIVNDSVEYIGGARNVLLGKGYSRIGGDGNPLPITHFPPMFSMVLISVSFFGLDAIRAAHLVNLLFFGANIALITILIRRLTGSKVFSLLGGLFFMLSEPILRVHSFILSEPLFQFLSFCIFWVLIEHLEKRRWYRVALLGLFSGMAFLDRYIGGSLFALVGLSFLLFVPEWKNKFRDLGFYLVFGLPGPIAWVIRNMIVSGNPTNRPFSYHPLENRQWHDGVRNFWSWLLPDYQGLIEPNLDLFGVALIIVMGVLTAYGTLWVFEIWHTRKEKHEVSYQGMQDRLEKHFCRPSMYVAAIAAIYAVLYFVLLLTAMTFFDEATTFEHRMLIPVYSSVILLLFGFLSYLYRHPAAAAKIIVVFACLGMFASIVEDSSDTIRELHSGGQGFASGRWRNSATMESVRQLPEGIKIFTNKRTAVYLLADRGSYVIPWRFYPDNPVPDPSYVEGVENYRNQVLRKEAVVVIFDYEQAIRDGDEPVMDMTEGMPILGMYDDGAIFGDLP